MARATGLGKLVRLEEERAQRDIWEGAIKCSSDRMLSHSFLACFCPRFGGRNLRRESNDAGVALQDLREVLRKRRARHDDIRACFLRLLL